MNLSELKNRNDKYSASPPKPDQVAKHDTIAQQVAEYEALGHVIEKLGYCIPGNEVVLGHTRRGVK